MLTTFLYSSALKGAPSHGIDVPFETTTPTGAALLAATVVTWGDLPPMVVQASGFGAGTRAEQGLANGRLSGHHMVQQPLVLGESLDEAQNERYIGERRRLDVNLELRHSSIRKFVDP